MRARMAVTGVFFLNGVVLASWISRIPAVKSDLGLSEGRLGLALLGAAVGALVAMPATGWVLPRVGSRVMTTTMVMALSAALVLPAVATSAVILALALAAIGATNGALDVSMNAHGVVVERRYGRPILTAFHGFWSLGGLAGAGIGGLFAARGVEPLAHFAVVAVVCLPLGFLISRGLLPAGVDRHAPEPSGGERRRTRVRYPRPIVVAGIVALACLLAEGAMADWSAVYLEQELGTGEGLAATGFAVFSLAMAIVRLLGDRLVLAWGAVAFVRAGGALVAIGLATGLVATAPWLAIAGFAVVGAGLAGIFPVVLSAAGRVGGIAAGPALAFVATLGYTGFLVGPPAIGLSADVVGLSVSLWGVVALGGVIVALAGSVRDHTVPAAATARQASRPAGQGV
ncbi:MAG: MFS transporter [Thermomicrobiales bacterium]